MKQNIIKNVNTARWWWCTALIPALGRQMEEDLVYRMSSRKTRAVIEKSCLNP